MKMLFITEKYVFVDEPRNGFTNSLHNTIGSWECAGLGEYHHIKMSKDPGDIWGAEQIDKALMTEEYDFAFVTPCDYINCSYDIAARLGKRLIMGWWDSLLSNPNVPPGGRLVEYAERGNTNIVFDMGKGEIGKNTFAMEVPQDTRIFHPRPDLSDDLDVSFVGAINTRGDRINMINILKSGGINIMTGGGRAYHDSNMPNMSVHDYASIHHRSKICLNPQFCGPVPGRKGRTFEIAACGKFMLANNGHVLDGWFDRDVHYVEFNNDNLVEKVRYYLDHPEERNRIAKNAYDKYMQEYSPRRFWEKVLAIASR